MIFCSINRIEISNYILTLNFIKESAGVDLGDDLGIGPENFNRTKILIKKLLLFFNEFIKTKTLFFLLIFSFEVKTFKS